MISEAVLGPIGITTGGKGYTFTPTVGITSVYIQQSNETEPLIMNAQAEAVVSTSGTVKEIRYSNAGAGYTNTTAYVAIGSVTSNSFGEFDVDELVTQVFLQEPVHTFLVGIPQIIFLKWWHQVVTLLW